MKRIFLGKWGLICFVFGVLFSMLTACEFYQSSSRARSYNIDMSRPFGVFSSDEVELRDINDFYKRVFGGADDDYWTDWERLNQFQSGSVDPERIPYLDSWYPERSQGTNVAGTLGKYDQAYHGGQSTAAAWELEYNSRQEPAWYGHCNGTSVAASRFQNPERSVLRPVGCAQDPNVTCVSFTPGDIRALLSEINMNARAKFISGNRCALTVEELNQRPLLRNNPTEMDACDDVNPASFHVGIVNFLGRKKQPVIFDMNYDSQVWNYPIYAYNYQVQGPLSEDEAIEESGYNLDSWVFNPEAVSWRLITMTISYRRAAGNFTGAGTRPAPATVEYTYILEFDAEGKVLGGEWIGDSRRNHPDFIWMAFEPADPTGSPSRGNPHVSNEEVISMWAESVGLDPNNPFRDKPKNAYDVRFYPKDDFSWGIVEGFYRVILDGSGSGSVFLGKPTHMRLLLEDNIPDGAQVEAFVNGESIGSAGAADGMIDFSFDSPRGMNTLRFNWSAPSISSSELNWEFKYVAM